MGYRGKLEEQARARELRADAWTLQQIADELGVSKSSVSVWVRDVAFTPRPRQRTATSVRGPNALRRRKLEQIARLRREGRDRIGSLDEQQFLVAGAMLYAGEGAKRGGSVKVTNTDPRIIAFHCAWLRHFFDVDETRLRVQLYLHEGLDLDVAIEYWVRVTAIPADQFIKPYRAKPDGGIRTTKHPYGCPGVAYSCTRTHRAVLGLMEALLDPASWPGSAYVDAIAAFGPNRVSTS